jgi:hypothetical protein
MKSETLIRDKLSDVNRMLVDVGYSDYASYLFITKEILEWVLK